MANKKPNTSGLRPYKKGASGNPYGRPKIAKPIKPILEKLLENTLPVIENEMRTDPEARISFFKDLTRIVLTTNR